MTPKRKSILLILGILGLLVASAAVYRTVMFSRFSSLDLAVECIDGPPGSRRFEISGAFSNDFSGLFSDPPAWCAPRDLRMGGESTGTGSGTIGSFSYTARWCMNDGVLESEDELFSTSRGDLYAHEVTRSKGDPGPVTAILRTILGPPIEFEGQFTFTGGTGEFSGVTGQANLVARQQGGGTTAMAACGHISD